MTTTDLSSSSPPPTAAQEADGEAGSGPADSSPERRSSHKLGPVLVSGGIYLLLGVMLWWHVWTGHPTSTTTCGCGDSSLFTWFLAWPAHALSHGLNPLYSTAMFHPTGVNLLSNTAEVGIGVALAPVTWLFGPVATLNVALTLSPALSALAMFVLLRRWVSWTPAAFVGGLFYGFSPFVLIALTDAHLMLGAAFIPPLVVACLDEILMRQHARPLVSGVLLGLLLTIQFFVGSEVLVIMVIAAAIGVIAVVFYGWLRRRTTLEDRARHAVLALASAGATAALLLAYPVWFALDGPAHLSGSIWGTPLISYGGANLKGYFLPEPPSPALTAQGLHYGGYQAPTLSGQYFGIGVIAILLIGCFLWRRDRRLWLFGGIAVISVLLSFGLGLHSWSLWRLFVRLPLMENIIPSRFLLVTYLCVAVMLGVILDRTHREVDHWRSRKLVTTGGRPLAGAVAGVVVSLIALVPIYAYYAGGLPLTVTPVILPVWFRSAAPNLGGHPVLLAFPVPYDLLQSAMTWQAVDGMHYSMVGGGGPNAIPQRAGKERAGQEAIGSFSISQGPQAVTPQVVISVRHALDGWGVTTVVIPDPDHLPAYEQVHRVRSTAVLITAAVGRSPIRQAGAWVWTDVNRAGPPLRPSAATLLRCGEGPAAGSVASIEQSVACVTSAPTEAK